MASGTGAVSDDPQVNRAQLVDLSGERNKMERFELTEGNSFSAEDSDFVAD